ncbi:hypothetical protein [Persicobacter diffluens]|uniref:Uncharacterized protein n=1 Tax=Persicobacter diffluens TaxID=981 RepID=A0AAN5APP5_9BACT|nr:hypothetical protein PEDI_50780 [Persicobacter diffluens]GJM64699.1 hypothetical protein PEDI_52510 [Persicobacter diffluens]
MKTNEYSKDKKPNEFLDRLQRNTEKHKVATLLIIAGLFVLSFIANEIYYRTRPKVRADFAPLEEKVMQTQQDFAEIDRWHKLESQLTRLLEKDSLTTEDSLLLKQIEKEIQNETD